MVSIRLIAFSGAFVSWLALVPAAVIHVSPLGNDAWSGSLEAPNPGRTDGPLASMAGARDVVRALKAKGPLADSVHVRFAGGEYPLSAAVGFTPVDAGTAASPVIYEAAPGARPVFLGGSEIKGIKAGADGIWRVKIPEVAEGKWYFEQLFVMGRRAVRAREPDLSPDTVLDVRLSHLNLSANTAASHFAIADVKETNLGGGKSRHSLIVDADAAKVLAPLDAAARKDLILMVYHNWDNTRRFITGYDAAAKSLVSEGRMMPTWNPWTKDGLFHVENFKQALDAPGEWFLDRDGTLAYIPRAGEDPAKLRFFAPRLEKWIRFEGDAAAGRFVEHVHMRGLAFRYSQWVTPPEGFEPAQAASSIEAAIMVDGARDLIFSDCEFGHTGGYAVWFRKGCRNIRLERTLIHDLGAGGIRIGETSIGPAGNERTSHITIDNNIIRSGGHLFPCAVGLLICQSGDNVVTHNDIGDLSYTGISSGWTWGYGESLAKRNRFEANHIHHIGKGLMSDMSGFYNLGLSEGTTVTGNLVHDIFARSYGGWGLYTDEGSTGVVMSDNIVYNTKTGGFHQHYGAKNRVKNNIFAYGLKWQVEFTRVEAHRSFDFTGNIVYWEEGTLYGGSAFRDGDAGLSRNLFWDASGKAVAFPAVSGGSGLAQWQAAGNDSGSRIADPLFRDPAHYDFRFKALGAASEIGFTPFDISDAGVYGDAAWIAKAKGNENFTDGLIAREPRMGGAGRTGMRLRRIASSPGGALRIGLTLQAPLDHLEVEVFDGRGKRATHRRYQGLPSGAFDIILPLEGASATKGILFLRLRSGPNGLSAPALTARIIR
ncbi:MAG: right-handed parallel beta-helix repeat-containing protein [Fibrobacterota bacterium]|nr:right-handed parallel beta-helix repeat-containing protein [Fibrobacterota bacterium]